LACCFHAFSCCFAAEIIRTAPLGLRLQPAQAWPSNGYFRPIEDKPKARPLHHRGLRCLVGGEVVLLRQTQELGVRFEDEILDGELDVGSGQLYCTVWHSPFWQQMRVGPDARSTTTCSGEDSSANLRHQALLARVKHWSMIPHPPAGRHQCGLDSILASNPQWPSSSASRPMVRCVPGC
jgi:hypothetical protein